MNRIIAEVLNKIAERQHQMKTVSFSNQAVPDEQIFVDYGNVTLQGVTLALLIDLYRVDRSNHWVNWILQGISYDVAFTFQINPKMISFIPLRMLRDWPVVFEVGSTAHVVAFYQKSIGRSDLAVLPDNTILIVTATQRLTSEAQAVMRQKHMIKQVRTDEDCIWQK